MMMQMQMAHRRPRPHRPHRRPRISIALGGGHTCARPSTSEMAAPPEARAQHVPLGTPAATTSGRRLSRGLLHCRTAGPWTAEAGRARGSRRGRSPVARGSWGVVPAPGKRKRKAGRPRRVANGEGKISVWQSGGESPWDEQIAAYFQAGVPRDRDAAAPPLHSHIIRSIILACLPAQPVTPPTLYSFLLSRPAPTVCPSPRPASPASPAAPVRHGLSSALPSALRLSLLHRLRRQCPGAPQPQ